MSDDNKNVNAEYVMVCEKCGTEYPLGTSYCTNPLCHANLAIYGKMVQKNARFDVDAACKKTEQMMEEVMSALSGKSFEAEKRPKYQDGFIRIMESMRSAKTDASLQNYLEQAEQWREACLNEISLLGENLESVRTQAEERISRARERVMSALTGKKNAQEKRKEYGARYDDLWTAVSNSSDINEIKKCAMQAETLAERFLAEISRLGDTDDGKTTTDDGKDGKEDVGTRSSDKNNGGMTGGTADSKYAAKLQREKQRAQKRIDAAMNKVLKALSKKKQADLYREKYTVGFKNISAQMQQCSTVEEVNAYAVQAEALRDSDLIEIKGMKNKRGVIKSVLLVLLVIFVLGFIEGIITSVMDLTRNSSSQENENNTSERTEGGSGEDYTWENNVLMSNFYGWNDSREVYDWPVFDSDDWVRGDITLIVFLDTLDSEGIDSWDVSEAHDGSVKAWVEKSGDDTILYVAGNGGVSAPENSEGLFVGYSAVSIEFGSAFHTDDVKSMRFMFEDCKNLQTVDVSRFNTSKVTDMSYMFDACSSLEKLDLTGFDTSKVTDMSFMFSFCWSLKEVDVSGFDTSKVTTMAFMFSWCTNVSDLDVSGFDTSEVKNMVGMFSSCSSLAELDLLGFDTSNVTDMSYMFHDCSSLCAIDISSFNTSNVTDMSYMFSGCDSLEQFIYSSLFDTSSVEDYTDFMDSVNLLNGDWKKLFE